MEPFVLAPPEAGQ